MALVYSREVLPCSADQLFLFLAEGVGRLYPQLMSDSAGQTKPSVLRRNRRRENSVETAK